MATMSSLKDRGALTVEDNSTGEASVTSTPQKITAFATKGVESGLTVDTANNEMVIAKAGDYKVTLDACFSGTGNATFFIYIYLNGAATGYRLKRNLGASGDVGAASRSGLLTCAVGDKIHAYQSSPDGSALTVEEGGLIAVRLS